MSQQQTNLLGKAAVLLTLAVAGLIAGLVLEVMRALATTPLDLSRMSGVGALAAMLCINGVAVLACFFAERAAGRWIALLLAGLLAVLYGLHVIEHLVVGDMAGGALNLLVMFAPCALATHAIWKSRREEAADGAA